MFYVNVLIQLAIIVFYEARNKRGDFSCGGIYTDSEKGIPAVSKRDHTIEMYTVDNEKKIYKSLKYISGCFIAHWGYNLLIQIMKVCWFLNNWGDFGLL